MNKFTRRTVIAAACAAAAMTFTPMSFAEQAPEKKDVTIAVGGKSLYYYLPLSIAEQLGYFKDEGLNVKIVDFQGGSRSLQAVVGGSADVVSGAFEHTISMQAKKQPMTAFVLQGRAPQLALVVSNKTMKDYKQLSDLKGKRVVLNIFPSLDTSVCATSVRKFNKLASSLPDTVVVAVSKDLPFAHARFCTTEGIENVVPASDFRASGFDEAYGVLMADGPLAGLLARAVVVIDKAGRVVYTELVPEITEEPDYDKAVEAVKAN